MSEYLDSLTHLFETHLDSSPGEWIPFDAETGSTLGEYALCGSVGISLLLGAWSLFLLAKKYREGRLSAKSESETESNNSNQAAQVKVSVPKLVPFVFQWTIDNFLACDLLNEAEYLDSPAFTPKGHDKERFKLRIHPRVGKDGNEVSLYLRYVPEPAESATVASRIATIEGEANSTETAPAATVVPAEQRAQIHAIARIDKPKELKANLKAGEEAGWLNFITRESLLSHLEGGKKSKLTIYLKGHLVVK